MFHFVLQVSEKKNTYLIESERETQNRTQQQKNANEFAKLNFSEFNELKVDPLALEKTTKLDYWQ